jgi:hypothetical protein
MQFSNVQPILKTIPKFKGVSPIVRLISSTLIAMCCIMFMPLSAFACGGFFSTDTPVDQNIERIIFTVHPGSTSVYEQINYTGSASNFAWVLPVPAVPKVSTASIDLFRDLDKQTVPRFFYSSPPPCGLAPLGGQGEFAGAPAPGGNVNVYGKGTAGPYAYDVIGTSNPGALTLWLQTHHYHVPDQLPSSIQPYIQAHMLFLAMRLQPQAGIQDITPVKITYPTTQSQVMIPLRMATFAAMPHMGLLVWIFGSSRFTPQNYQSIHISDEELTNAGYTNLLDKSVSQSNGHAFITEYAQPAGNLSVGNSSPLYDLKQHYPYVTRLYTRISPEQMTLDPIFTEQNGLSNVSNLHEIPAPNMCDSFNLWLGSLGTAVYPLVAGIVVILVALAVGGILLTRRRKADGK